MIALHSFKEPARCMQASFSMVLLTDANNLGESWSVLYRKTGIRKLENLENSDLSDLFFRAKVISLTSDDGIIQISLRVRERERERTSAIPPIGRESERDTHTHRRTSITSLTFLGRGTHGVRISLRWSMLCRSAKREFVLHK